VRRLLAIDLGAESGRAVVGGFDGARLHLEEVHRFANVPVRLGGTLYWDFPRLFGDVLEGLHRAGEVDSIGVDTWGVDFGLLDGRGRLLSNPVHYRDQRTAGVIERLPVPRECVYAATGIQIIPINTLYQLFAMVESHDQDLERADRLLLMPDLVHHFLCDSVLTEYTNATTTQCFDVSHNAWANDLLGELRIPTRIFPEVAEPGRVLGTLREDIGTGAKVVAPGTHDTASAVASIPLAGHTAFLSSGTWSLMGLEIDRPITSDAARQANLTNEGGVGGTIRLLKNVMGLWLLQQARRGLDVSYDELAWRAADAPAFTVWIDPDDERFLRPTNLIETVEAYCRETGQVMHSSMSGAALVRVVLESLALKYAVVLRQLRAVTGRSIEAIRVVGGGSKNALLCQFTANACGVPVLAGPVEATATGNLLVQGIALGELRSLAEARELVARSILTQTYEPKEDWAEPRLRFEELLAGGNVA
jgi:rhamnulokinase